MSQTSTSQVLQDEPDPSIDEKSGKVREVGSQASWSLSSCKPGKTSNQKVELKIVRTYFSNSLSRVYIV